MPAPILGQTPSLSTFLKSLKTNDVDSSIELFVSLLKRRQIKNSRPCALATTQLLLRVVAAERIRDAQQLIDRIREVGRRLVAAQPREMAVGNIVRRVLGVVRDVMEQDEQESSVGSEQVSAATSPTRSQERRPSLPKTFSGISPLGQAAAIPQDFQPRPPIPVIRDASPPNADRSTSASDRGSRRPQLSASSSYATQAPPVSSLLSLLDEPMGRSPLGTPPAGTQSPVVRPMRHEVNGENIREKIDIKAEVIVGIKELVDELEIVDSQIAESALDHIHSNEFILTHTSSQTVQKFLMTVARKRKFTVVHAEAYPNNHEETHSTIVNGGRKGAGDDDDEDERWKPLTSMGITVILIPDTAVFALMERINKVILAPHSVLANGSLIAAAGASTIAMAAKEHRKPVIVLSGVYKLSPVYPFDAQDMIEYGDPGKVVPFEDGEFMDKVDVVNPVYDWVDAEYVDLYITNLGGCAPSFLYRIVADHYRTEDIDLGGRT